MPMPGCKRSPTARDLAPLARVLSVAGGLAALLVAAGCNSDVTRFNLLGSDFFNAQPAAERAAASPVGYAPASSGPPGYAAPSRSYYPGAQGNGPSQ